MPHVAGIGVITWYGWKHSVELSWINVIRAVFVAGCRNLAAFDGPLNRHLTFARRSCRLCQAVSHRCIVTSHWYGVVAYHCITTTAAPSRQPKDGVMHRRLLGNARAGRGPRYQKE